MDQNFKYIAPPTTLSITSTSRCNMHCVMCPHGFSKIDVEDFDPALLPRLEEYLAHVKTFDLTGLGEPLLAKSFWDIMEAMPVRNNVEPVLMFNTNGSMLTEKNIEKILKARVQKIRISIDAADPEIYFSIRGMPLTPVLEGVRRLINRRNETGQTFPAIGIEMTIMKYNLYEVKPMIRLAKALNVDFFEGWQINEMPRKQAVHCNVPFHSAPRKNRYSKLVSRFKPKIFRYSKQMLSTMSAEKIRSLKRKWLAFASELSMPAAFYIGGEGDVIPNIGEPIKWEERSIPCPLPWLQLRADYHGGITVCCWGAHRIGDLCKQSAKEIWEGEAMTEMRMNLYEGRIPALCKDSSCPYLNGRDYN